MRKLYIVEGLPCSGKSTTSAFVAEQLKANHKVCFFDEGIGNHPADYEFSAFVDKAAFDGFSTDEQAEIAAAGIQTSGGIVVPLSKFSGELFDKLLQYKIYDFLPWETEYPVMLSKWRSFVENANKNAVYVFNCVLLQNPMCETMMRFGFPLNKSLEYISAIADIIKPFNPAVIYLKNDDIASAVEKAAKQREGWLDGVIDYHTNGAYGKSINASGFEGYISCLEERRRRELEILPQLSIESLVVDNPHRDWQSAYRLIGEFLQN